MGEKRFKCSECGCAATQEKHLSVGKINDKGEQILFYTCNGQNSRSPHPPIFTQVYKLYAMEGDGAEIRRVLKSMKITDVQVKIAEEELDRLMAGFREWAKSEFTPEAIKTRERVKRAIT